jgi:hypothetical protein
MKELTNAQKLDILLGLAKEYNLKETNDPAVYTMSCGGGYTLFACVSRSWYFCFDDGIEKTEYEIDSERVQFTYTKDALALHTRYTDACKRALSVNSWVKNPENVSPRAKSKSRTGKKKTVKNKEEEYVGMKLPIAYPSELVGKFMVFKQWTEKNNVIPGDSEVIILDEDEYNYRVSIPKAHISFDIPVSKFQVIEVDA